MTSKKVPVNIVTGPLGVGKTTAINHLIAQRPAEEKWAILLNEYGQIGLDAALMDLRRANDSVGVREVAGGCICCSAGIMFEVELVLLLRQRPDRLLIEPTGLATVSGILETLGRDGIREAVDLRSVVCLLDPRNLDAASFTVELSDQVDAADVLVANRSDVASEAELAAFESWAADLFPPKAAILRTSRGQLDLAVLDHVSSAQRDNADARSRQDVHSASTRAAPGHPHDHGHDHDHEHLEGELDPTKIVRRVHESALASTVGWALPAEHVFQTDRIEHWLARCLARKGLQRLKGVFQTDRGWFSINYSDGVQEMKSSGYRRDSRVELIFNEATLENPDRMESELLDCLR